MAELKSNVDQSLIDLAVKNGYTEEQARAYYGKNPTATSSNASPVQTGDSPATDWALQQGKKQIENQPAALAALKEPDVPAAAAQLVPAAANTLNANASGLFHGLDFSGEASGALEAAGAYGLYKTLKDKVIGGNTPPPPPPPPPPPVVTSAPTATPETPAPSGMAKLQERFNLVPKKELTPDETRQQKLKIAAVNAQQNMSPIEGAAAPISGQGATPLIPASPAPTDTPPITPPAAPPAPPPPPVPPSASPEPTPESAIVNNTMGASPVDKANALVQTPETPAVEISKVAPVAATPVEGAAVPRTTKNVLAFPDVPAPVIPPGTPANARRTAEQIAVLKAEDPLNKGYNQVSRAAGITAETPAPEARSFMDRVTNEVFGGKPPASQGGAAPQAKQITNFIETNQKDFPNIYSKLKEIQAKYPTQSGSAHLGMLAGIAGLGLGALGAYGAYKEGKQTGDWTNLGLLGGSLLAMSAPAQAAYQAATYSKPLGETPEELKAFGQMLKNSQQAFKIGAGRGVAPPSSYNR